MKSKGGRRAGAGRKPTVAGGTKRTVSLSPDAWRRAQAEAERLESSASAVLDGLAKTLPKS